MKVDRDYDEWLRAIFCMTHEIIRHYDSVFMSFNSFTITLSTGVIAFLHTSAINQKDLITFLFLFPILITILALFVSGWIVSKFNLSFRRLVLIELELECYTPGKFVRGQLYPTALKQSGQTL